MLTLARRGSDRRGRPPHARARARLAALRRAAYSVACPVGTIRPIVRRFFRHVALMQGRSLRKSGAVAAMVHDTPPYGVGPISVKPRRTTLGDARVVLQGIHMVCEEAARQFSFRLPEELIERAEHCVAGLRESGLEVTRADVVRLLSKQALDATQGRVSRLLGKRTPKQRVRRRLTGRRAPR